MLEDELAAALFGRLDPLGQMRPHRLPAVPGHRHLSAARQHLPAAGPGIGAIVPSRPAQDRFHYDETNEPVHRGEAASRRAGRPRPRTWSPSRCAGPAGCGRGRPTPSISSPRTRSSTCQPAHLDVLPGDGRAVQRGAAGRRHRRDGDHDGLGHRPHPGDRPAEGAAARPGGRSSGSSWSKPRRSPCSAGCSASCSVWAWARSSSRSSRLQSACRSGARSWPRCVSHRDRARLRAAARPTGRRGWIRWRRCGTSKAIASVHRRAIAAYMLAATSSTSTVSLVKYGSA